MGFTRDFDIFLYLRENEEEVYTILFPSPLYIFLIHLPFFCKKKLKKKTVFFLAKMSAKLQDKFFLEFCSELQLSILFPLVIPILHFLQSKKNAKLYPSHFSKNLMTAIFSQKKLIIFLLYGNRPFSKIKKYCKK